MIFENPAQLPQQFHNEESSYIIIRVSSRNQDAKQQKFASFAWIFSAFLRQYAPQNSQNIICGCKFSPQNFLRSQIFLLSQAVCAVAIFFMAIEIIASSLYSILPANFIFDTKLSVQLKAG